MTLDDIDLISIQSIKNISVQTSQKIPKQNLNNFIISSLQINDISLNKNNKIFYTYISEANIYEIYILNSYNLNAKLQINIFESKLNEIYELFILKDYFIVYKNNEFYFYKENKSYEINDILEFIKYKYNINIKSYQVINNDIYLKYKNKYIKNKTKSKINFINLNKSNSFSIYLLYLSVLLLFSIYYYNNNYKQEPVINKIIEEKNNYKLNNIVKNLNKYNIQVQNIKYNNEYTLTIQSKSKNNIFKFLYDYENNIKIKTLYKNKKTYILDISINA